MLYQEPPQKREWISVPHRRSLEARQRRDAKRLAMQSSFRDPEQAETVCIINTQTICEALQQKYGFVNMNTIDIERGEVLIDSRGRGTFQNIQPVRR